MKLVVGLGNPGRKYEGTRHNVGFRVVAEVARKYAGSSPKTAFQGELVEVHIAGQGGLIHRTLLLCPQTFMNLSGSSVLAARDFYKINNDDLLVVCDDFNIPLGRLRMRATGSAGGQKGLADIIGRLGTDAVSRLRVGVGPVPNGWDAADFVLGKFAKDQQTEIEIVVAEAVDAVSDWVSLGIANAMNRHNPAGEK
jgi:PTH1 family peptidyl-tRNA hydrolase